MRLALSTWPEVEKKLSQCPAILVPIGSMEQHGPNGLIGTDAICAETIAHGVGENADALVGPSLFYGVAPFNLGFAGTVTLRATTLMDVVQDYICSAAQHGITHVYFLNGHGGNIAPVNAAFSSYYSDASFRRNEDSASMSLFLRSWWEYPQTNKLRQSLYGEAEGMHATPSEVSITQQAYPEAIKAADMGPWTPVSAHFMATHGGDAHYDAADHRRRFPDGRIGSDPSQSTPEHGDKLLQLAIQEAAEDYHVFTRAP